MKKIVYYDLRHFCSAAKKGTVTPIQHRLFLDLYFIETKKGALRYTPSRYHDGTAVKLLALHLSTQIRNTSGKAMFQVNANRIDQVISSYVHKERQSLPPAFDEIFNPFLNFCH